MNTADFLNAIKAEMGKTPQPWEFEGDFVYRKEPQTQAYYYAVGVKTLNSHQQAVAIWSSVDGWDAVSQPECADYATWLRDRLQGKVRDEAGNRHPRQPLTLTADEIERIELN